MREIRPVRPRSSIDRPLPGVMLLVVVALAFAVVKPWSWFPDPAATGVTASASTSLAPSARRVPTKPNGFEELVYDPSIFGIHEPQAACALWPATFRVTFGFVFQVPDVAAAPPTQPSGSVSPSAAASTAASPSGSEGPAATQDQTPDGGPAWP